jgi:hypothetical protein
MAIGDHFKSLGLVEASQANFFRRPIFLLILMAFAMPIAFSVWTALLNNFVIEVGGFTGVEIGWLHTFREIPGFLAVGVILLIFIIREQVLALVSLALLGFATSLTAFFPEYSGILILTVLGSIGFHYYETVNQSLQLQWIDKTVAPQVLGWVSAVGSFASLLAYGAIVITWKAFNLSYSFVYMTSGGITVLIALICFFIFPQIEAPRPQVNRVVIRSQYWLYYALQFMAGARRQIFLVFAAFMMVKKFNFEVHEVTFLFLINFALSMLFSPLVGKAIAIYGERKILALEYIGLTFVFLAYGGIYYFGWGAKVAIFLFIANHLLFAMSFALKTYLQKISDPSDISPTTAVAFTINHIAAVFLPAVLGYLWITNPIGVFIIAALMALISVFLSMLIPSHPSIGRETIFVN